ncbi:hypothetical protein K439DRAFT_1618327 [Ramaria rubella]|nr:hypothetical protein K439DRAFT_1618327 [Ramaria rubella]
MNDEDIWVKSLVIENDPLDLLKHGWLLQKYEKPPIMMLMQQYGQGMGTEVGFRLQGILVDMKLPLVHVYLSPKSHGDAVAISNLVEPLGLIKKCDDQFVYNKNNVVQYYSHRRPNAEMNAPVYTYEPVDPAIFHLGHLMELQVAFYL